MIVTESLVWLVLEYCPGDELYHHLLTHGRMEAGKVQKIFTQLVGAVSFVHSKSCVHRDLKLENILLDKNENVKLVDFGFTREYQGTTSYLQTWCGTVCYSAPEMLKGEKYAGEKVDVWSLGIILYALLCGELPWDEDDDAATKIRILREEPNYPEYIPEPAKELLKKLLSKRPLLRPALADVLKDPWLAEHAPQQQEVLKVQQPAPFTTQLEKDTLQRMRSAGVDIDMVIEHVLSQRCDSLAGWWALLIEKEQRKEKRRERKRKEREAEAKAIRRLSAASGRLLSLGEVNEGDEAAILESPKVRGRRMTRANGSATQATELPKVTEAKSPTTETEPPPISPKGAPREESRSRSRPPPPPKDYQFAPPRRPRNLSRGSGSMLRNVTTNPDLLSPQYIPQPQRKRRAIIQQPLKEQLSWVKQWFKESAYKRGKSPNDSTTKKGAQSTPQLVPNAQGVTEQDILRELKRTSTGPITTQQHRKASIGTRPELQTRATHPARPRVNTNSTADSHTSIQRKRQSLSPHTLTPHSSIRRSSAGLRGRKSTSSSVSSVRSTYQTHHQHSHSKASSTSSASLASPSGLSTASGSRVVRSPHTSVKVLPTTPNTGTFPSSIRVSRRPPPSGLGSLPSFAETKNSFSNIPGSPGLPVFRRRKRSVFKGPGGIGGSPSSHLNRAANSRSNSLPRKSGEMIPEITEEDEEEDEIEDLEVEEVENFGPRFLLSSDLDAAVDDTGEVYTEPVSPMSPLTPKVDEPPTQNRSGSGGVPLTAEALAKMEEEEEEQEKQAVAA